MIGSFAAFTFLTVKIIEDQVLQSPILMIANFHQFAEPSLDFTSLN
jgi:hypothetical protein